MKVDALKQYAKLHQQLTDEKFRLESRLREINAVLQPESVEIASSPLDKITTEYLEGTLPPPTSHARKSKAGNTMTMREAVLKALSNGPVARKDLVKAVEGVGYKFNTKNPLNSIGSILYAKNGPVKSKDGQFFIAEGVKQSSGASRGHAFDTEMTTPTKKTRKLSAAGRARIAAAARAMWARRKAGK